MPYCSDCGKYIEDGQICGCNSHNLTPTSMKPFRERIKTWPKLTRQSLKVIWILVIVVVVLSLLIPTISNAIDRAQQSSLNKQAEAYFTKMFTSAIEGKNFNVLELAWVNDDEYVKSIKISYDNLVAMFKPREDGSGFNSIKITNINVSSYGKPDRSQPFSSEMTIEYDYVFSDIWDDKTRERSGSDYTTVSSVLVYENGKWVLQRIDFGYWYP